MPGKSSADEDIKEINNSDMSAKELAKAIESQAEQAGSKTVRAGKGSLKKPKEEATKTETKSEDKAKTKTESDAEDSQSPKTDDGEDGGVPIIVKRRNSYMNKSTDQSGADQDASDKKVQPQAETKIKVAGTKTIEPPTTTTVASEGVDSSTPEPVTEQDKQTDIASAAAEEANPETVEKKPAASPSTPPSPESKSDSDSKPDNTLPQSANQPTSPANASTKSSVAASTVNLPVNKLGKENGDQIKQQKPTVFDTDQYHLPIKVRNRRYVNNAISWTILTLVFSVVGGYVMYKLEVLDLSVLGL